MSVEFGGIPSQQTIRCGLSIPSLNNVAGSTQMGWLVINSLPPGPDPDHKYAPISSSIGPPPGVTFQSRAEIEVEDLPSSGVFARYNIVCRALDSDAESIISSANNVVMLGVRQHVATTIDFNTRECKIYLNGVLIATGIGANLTAGNSDNTDGKVMALGSEDDGLSEFFDGRLEDARQYDRVLSADEIQTIYECEGVDGIAFGLQQRYELQSGFEGQNVSQLSPQDSAAQQLNASVTSANSPVYRESIGPTFRRRLP